MSIYNLEKFGDKLREIRKNLKINQSTVAEATGIAKRTISNIESGNVIPTLDTLEILSAYYKTDLIFILLQYRLDDYSIYYRLKNNIYAKLENYAFDGLHVEIKDLKMMLESTQNTYIEKIIRQLILYTESIICFNMENDFDTAINKCVEAIRIAIPTFTFNNFKSFNYSNMEMKLLMNMGYIYINKNIDKIDCCLDILIFCISLLELNAPDEIYSWTCSNLAHIYQLKEDYENVLKYANLGIESSQKSKDYSNLITLYAYKGISQGKLNDKEFKKSLETSLYLCDAFNKIEMKEHITKVCDSMFGIKL